MRLRAGVTMARRWAGLALVPLVLLLTVMAPAAASPTLARASMSAPLPAPPASCPPGWIAAPPAQRLPVGHRHCLALKKDGPTRPLARSAHDRGLGLVSRSAQASS